MPDDHRRQPDPLPPSAHGMVMTLPPGALTADGALRAQEATLPVGTRLGEFEITGLVGEGGFGIVYLATDHLLGRQVALKEYMPSALAARGAQAQVTVRSERHAETFEAGRRSFVNEARLLAQFDHPALVKVFRFWEANGTAYMVMPYYRGRTLRQVLADLGQPPPQPWLEQLLRPLLDALETMHGAQCYHRDIAPDNILVLDNGRPVLLDFGAARRVIGDITQALTVILKPGFAPLEQYANGPEMKQGPWTDVYALAAVVYYCATLKTPVPSVSRMMKDTLEPLQALAGGRYDERFCAAVERGLAVGIDDRIQDMAQFREALGLDGDDLPATAIGRSGSGAPGSMREDFDRTIIDPGLLPQAGGGATGGRQDRSSTLPPGGFIEEKVMRSSSSSPPPKNEKPWTPNADVQLEHLAAAQAAETGRASRAIPAVIALVVLVAAGVAGYWLWGPGDDRQGPVAQAPQAVPGTGPAPAASQPPAPTAAPSAAPSAPPSGLPSAAPPSTGLPPVSAPAASPPPAAAGTPPAPSMAAPAPSLVPSLVPDTSPAPGPLASALPTIDGGGALPVGRIIDLLHQQRDPAWAVAVQVTADRVKIGQDRLRFRLRSDRDGYVYLLMQGTDRSHFYQLFPNGLDKNNRMRAKSELALPRSNWEMVAGGPPGVNRFIALVTPTPRSFSGVGLDGAQPFSEFDVQLASRIFAEKGAAPFAGEPTGCKQGDASCAAYGATLFEIEEY